MSFLKIKYKQKPFIIFIFIIDFIDKMNAHLDNDSQSVYELLNIGSSNCQRYITSQFNKLMHVHYNKQFRKQLEKNKSNWKERKRKIFFSTLLHRNLSFRINFLHLIRRASKYVYSWMYYIKYSKAWKEKVRSDIFNKLKAFEI